MDCVKSEPCAYERALNTFVVSSKVFGLRSADSKSVAELSIAYYGVHCIHRLHKIGVILSTLSIVSTWYHGRCTQVAPEKRKGDLYRLITN
jgi:hypothetical protein